MPASASRAGVSSQTGAGAVAGSAPSRESSVGMELTRKSWFTALIGGNEAEHHIVMIKDRPLNKLKADLLQAFLWVCS